MYLVTVRLCDTYEWLIHLFFLFPRTAVLSLTGEIKKKEKTLHEATVSRTGERIYDE